MPMIVDPAWGRRKVALDANHRLVGDLCPACDVALKVGDEVTEVPVGPASQVDWDLMLAGKSYEAATEYVHWHCRKWRPREHCPVWEERP
jgi:hypothetical protein